MEKREITMFDDFIVRALLAGTGVAIVTGILGCFVVWRRMAYFGDSLSHTALLGVALGMLYHINLTFTIIAVCAFCAILIVHLQQKKILATDTLLGIMAHGALSVGLVSVSLMDNVRFNLHDYLFGDILTITPLDLIWIYASGAGVVFLLIWNWSKLTLMTVHEDLAMAEGVNVFAMHLLLMLLMTITVAISLQIVGILLITSMLIIPAATARQISSSPEMMAVIAILCGIIAVFSGIFGSMWLDIPSGPAIVASGTVIFVIVLTVVMAVKSIGYRQNRG